MRRSGNATGIRGLDRRAGPRSYAARRSVAHTTTLTAAETVGAIIDRFDETTVTT
jgi:hypothetical protein